MMKNKEFTIIDLIHSIELIAQNYRNKAIKSIKGEEESKAAQMIFDFGGFNNAFANETTDDFELISFLVAE